MIESKSTKNGTKDLWKSIFLRRIEMSLYGLHNLIKMFLYLEGPKELEIRNKTFGIMIFS